MQKIPEGLIVRYKHSRVGLKDASDPTSGHRVTRSARYWKEAGITMATKGGSTEAFLYDQDNVIVAHGHADCSEHENFCRRLGRYIALGRALKQYAEGGIDDV